MAVVKDPQYGNRFINVNTTRQDMLACIMPGHVLLENALQVCSSYTISLLLA